MVEKRKIKQNVIVGRYYVVCSVFLAENVLFRQRHNSLFTMKRDLQRSSTVPPCAKLAYYLRYKTFLALVLG